LFACRTATAGAGIAGLRCWETSSASGSVALTARSLTTPRIGGLSYRRMAHDRRKLLDGSPRQRRAQARKSPCARSLPLS